MTPNELAHALRVATETALNSEQFQRKLAKQIARNTAKGVFVAQLLLLTLAFAAAFLLLPMLKK